MARLGLRRESALSAYAYVYNSVLSPLSAYAAHAGSGERALSLHTLLCCCVCMAHSLLSALCIRSVCRALSAYAAYAGSGESALSLHTLRCRCFTAALLLLYCTYMPDAALLQLYCCFTADLLLIYCCFTAASGAQPAAALLLYRGSALFLLYCCFTYCCFIAALLPLYCRCTASLQPAARRLEKSPRARR